MADLLPNSGVYDGIYSDVKLTTVR